MNKFIYIVLSGLLLACSTDDDAGNVITQDFIDNDGDGVANSVETNSGTDPNDGCSFVLADQDFGKSTPAWRNQDCDGDGVINGTEIDPDGNDTNDGNGSDPLDNCSLDFTKQTIQPSTEWLASDCDEDCVSNEDEIDANTDPTDPIVFPGSGTKLQSVTWFETDESIKRQTIFNDDGTRIMEHLYTDNLLFWASYSYDANNRLSQFTTQISLVEFEYQGDLISSITKAGANDYSKSVLYEGNEITTDDGNSPQGYFSDKIVLNATTGKAQTVESFRQAFNNPDLYFYAIREFNYDASGMNTVLIETTNLEYDEQTGMFSPSPGGNVTEAMEYEEQALNPTQAAFEDLYIHGLLEDEINFGALFQNKCAGCPNLMNQYAVWFQLGFDERYLTINCVQQNGLPFMADRSSFYEPSIENVVYIYKN